MSHPSHPFNETWIDKQIREAQARGEFDDLPGAGKPLTNLGDPHGAPDDDWWIRGFIQREQLDMTGALPGPLALRKEAAGFPESLVDVRTEEQVREIVEDYNRRVRVDRLRPTVGDLPPLLARTFSADELDALVVRWRALRDERLEEERVARLASAAHAGTPTARRRWWRRSDAAGHRS